MLTNKSSNQKGNALVIGVALVTVVLVVVMIFAKPGGSSDAQDAQADAEHSQANVSAALGDAKGELTVSESSYDFGTISMAKGDVSKTFKVKNETDNAVKIDKMYSSCMCTTAIFMRGNGKRTGPFGMPGHGFVPPLGESLKPGEEADIVVTFDPKAHGPAGVGKIARTVYLEYPGGTATELNFTANVTP